VALQIHVAARAQREIDAADRWWASNRPAAPGAIQADLAEALSLLVEQPGLGTPCQGVRLAGLRRLYLRRVRYFVYYRLAPGRLQVLAFWHESRERGPLI